MNIRLAIAGEEVVGHSREFAEAALSPRGQAAVILGAKALAMTVLDVILQPQLVQNAWQEHDRAMSIRNRNY